MPRTLKTQALIAYNLRTGRELWCYVIVGGSVAVTEQSVTLGSTSAGTSTAGIASFDAVTGILKWEADGPFGQWYDMSHSSTALYVTDGSNHNRLHALSITNGTQLWHANFANDMLGEAVQEQGVVFVFLVGPQHTIGTKMPNRLVTLDAKTARVYWEREIA
ncbi:MAG TPA: PQQ-binding-like beta-propeller repeat protein [Ktedonobacterales bacterium]|jgi:outer membrane protein assembly factor BamB|nr:PQQ-binding-like beta-propeller repeat protein [Ktedonobacterales bacterium]